VGLTHDPTWPGLLSSPSHLFSNDSSSPAIPSVSQVTDPMDTTRSYRGGLPLGAVAFAQTSTSLQKPVLVAGIRFGVIAMMWNQTKLNIAVTRFAGFVSNLPLSDSLRRRTGAVPPREGWHLEQRRQAPHQAQEWRS
jgi:hypothetical protein